MPPLYFEDVEVGLRFETPRRTVTEADLVAFAKRPIAQPVRLGDLGSAER